MIQVVSTDAKKLEGDLSRLLRQLRIGDSLLFLNRVLAVSRGDLEDRPTQLRLQQFCPSGVPTFVVHLITKYLMKHGRSNTAFSLDWSQFPRIADRAFKLAVSDPISDSSDEAVRGLLVRMMSQQMRRHIPMQSYGLAIALFQDLDPLEGPKPFDLRKEVEQTIKMPVELFMRIGLAAHSAAQARLNGTALHGTLNLDWLRCAAEQMPSVPWLEKWGIVESAIAVTPQEFNRAAEASPEVPGEYLAYAFNPLRRKPVIHVESDRYIAVDPWLLVDRTSWGVFYDLFERCAGNARAVRDLTSNFGQPFEVLTGCLLESGLAAALLWKESNSQIAKARRMTSHSHKLGDFAYRSSTHPVMIECAALRPTANLCAQASNGHCVDAAKRVCKEIIQGFEHIGRIQQGEWMSEGLLPGAWVVLVVTFGRFETINGHFFRKTIDELLALEADQSYPYLVLSIEELDTVVRQSELGEDFGEVISKLASQPTYDTLAQFRSTNWRDHISTYALTRAERMYSFVPS